MDEKIAVLTDTNSGITPEQAARYGIYLVAMPVIIDDQHSNISNVQVWAML